MGSFFADNLVGEGGELMLVATLAVKLVLGSSNGNELRARSLSTGCRRRMQMPKLLSGRVAWDGQEEARLLRPSRSPVTASELIPTAFEEPSTSVETASTPPTHALAVESAGINCD